MKMIPVVSSNLEAVAYDSAEQQLQVKFKGGKTFAYAGVPAADYDALIKAESIGRHFGAHIRGKFPTTQVDPPAPVPAP